MSELPEYVLSAIRDVQAYADDAQECAEAVRMMVPTLRDVEEYAAAAEELLKLTRSTWPAVEYIQLQTDQARQALALAGLLLTHADQLVLSANLGLLRPAERAAGRHRTASASLTITPTFGAQAQVGVTASASLTVTPTFGAQAQVVKAVEANEVDKPTDGRPEGRRSIDLAALGMKLVIAWALVFPMLEQLMTADQQAILNNYISTVAFALAVLWRYNDTRKH